MSEKRPTREQAIEAAKRGWASKIPAQVVTLGSSGEAAVDAVAALFGGYAPSVVEVPVLTDRLFEKGGAGPSDRVNSAVAARSNAWEELRGLLLSSLATIRAEPLLGEPGRSHLDAALDLMSRPKMGVGPRGMS